MFSTVSVTAPIGRKDDLIAFFEQAYGYCVVRTDLTAWSSHNENNRSAVGMIGDIALHRDVTPIAGAEPVVVSLIVDILLIMCAVIVSLRRPKMSLLDVPKKARSIIAPEAAERLNPTCWRCGAS